MHVIVVFVVFVVFFQLKYYALIKSIQFAFVYNTRARKIDVTAEVSYSIMYNIVIQFNVESIIECRSMLSAR